MQSPEFYPQNTGTIRSIASSLQPAVYRVNHAYASSSDSHETPPTSPYAGVQCKEHADQEYEDVESRMLLLASHASDEFKQRLRGVLASLRQLLAAVGHDASYHFEFSEFAQVFDCLLEYQGAGINSALSSVYAADQSPVPLIIWPVPIINCFLASARTPGRVMLFREGCRYVLRVLSLLGGGPDIVWLFVEAVWDLLVASMASDKVDVAETAYQTLAECLDSVDVDRAVACKVVLIRTNWSRFSLDSHRQFRQSVAMLLRQVAGRLIFKDPVRNEELQRSILDCIKELETTVYVENDYQTTVSISSRLAEVRKDYLAEEASHSNAHSFRSVHTSGRVLEPSASPQFHKRISKLHEFLSTPDFRVVVERNRLQPVPETASTSPPASSLLIRRPSIWRRMRARVSRYFRGT